MKSKYPLLDSGLLTLGFVGWLLVSSTVLVVAVVIVAFAVFVPYMVSGGLTGDVNALMQSINDVVSNPYLLYAFTGIAELLLIVPFFFYLKIKKLPLKALMGNRATALQCALAALVGLMLSPALTGLDVLFSTLLRALGATIPDTSALEPKTFGQLAVGMLAIGVAAGVVEEPIFRGVTLRGLGSVLGKWGAVLLSGVVFSLIHMEGVGFVVRFFVGVVLGLMAWRCGSVLPGIFAHAAFNSSSLLVSFLLGRFLPGWEGFTFPGVGAEASVVLTFLVLSIPFAALSVGAYWLFARVTPAASRWRDQPYVKKADVKGSHWLAWAGVIVVSVGLTLTTMAMMWMPSMMDMLDQLGSLPK